MKAPGSLEDLSFVQEIVEVRYPKAHRYWDASGHLIARIEERLPSLQCRRLDNDGFEFRGEEGSITSARFYWDRAGVFTDAPGPHDRFEADAAEFLGLALAGLGVETLQRVGNRYIYIFKTDEAQRLLEDRPLWEPTKAMTAFGAPLSNGAVLRTTVPEVGRRIRLEVESGSSDVRGRTEKGVKLDIDFAAVEPPAVADLRVLEFVAWNRRFVRENLHKVLR